MSQRSDSANAIETILNIVRNYQEGDKKLHKEFEELLEPLIQKIYTTIQHVEIVMI